MENPKGQYMQLTTNYRHRRILMELRPTTTKNRGFQNAYYRGARAHLEGDHVNPYTARAYRRFWKQGHDAAQKCAG